MNPVTAFLVGYNFVGSHNAKMREFETKIEIDKLKRDLGNAKSAASKISSISAQLDQSLKTNYSLNNTVDALRIQLAETKELAHAWEARAVVMETKQNSWKDVIRNLLTRGEITITKEEVQQRFHKHYDVLVETNLSAMRTKWTNR